jgi:chemotaxis-related protein WspB
MMLMLLFHLGNSQYAIPAAEVVEVTPRVALAAIAQAPDYVAGLFNYRGRHVPVIDLCQILRNRSCRDSFTTRTILVDFPLAGGGSQTLGLLAERVTETIEIDPAAFTTTGLNMPDAPYLGQATRCDADLIQKITIAELLPDSVQQQLFPGEAG